ncbi:hypothetical protein BpHYR1_048909 [Brachionus plicatilis]|uniref:Uncharacterized protein n=1 Tax=Brachionus plicatilis TaxID=10195 RepID=A0A3M7S1J3_BRAPC|nr:hypothetical protein BpHYR1_048909 [Brachionus plicatilis]
MSSSKRLYLFICSLYLAPLNKRIYHHLVRFIDILGKKAKWINDEKSKRGREKTLSRLSECLNISKNIKNGKCWETEIKSD